jgi:Xaa-Pro aminopeptidase
MELDWHADRAVSVELLQIDTDGHDIDIDMEQVRRYRLERVRSQMIEYGIDAVVLSDPVNIRYASGTRNMQVFSSRNQPARYLLVTPQRTILHEFTGCMHLANGFETIDEVRPALTASYVAGGDENADRERAWAEEMGRTITELAGAGATVGLERLNAGAALALHDLGFVIRDAQAPVERARAIKSTEELKCVRASLRATEIGVGRLRDAIRPGISENALWSVLHQAIIEQDGDYIETRLLNSGPRTNPWFQETGPRIIETNELIALDTDVVGCHGYYADFSRTFHAGPDAPSDTQRELYRTAYEQVHHNMAILKPGMSFRDYADRAWPIPEKYFANRYYLSAHGTGMTGEYPYLYHRADFPDAGYDGVIEPGMTLCVESFIGEENRGEGVKLEQQVLITETGTELLSRFPFEDDLLRS